MQGQPLLENGNQDVDGDGNPDLSLNRIFTMAVKGFDSQVLFDPFKKQFYLPTRLIKVRDGEGRKIKVVSEKNKPAALFQVIEADAAKRVRIVFQRSHRGEDDSVIGAQPRGLIDGPRVTPVQ